MQKVFLGSWGHARLDPSIRLSRSSKEENWRWYPDYNDGAKAGELFGEDEEKALTKFSIPPLTRAFSGGFDYYPFLLYDKVVMDKMGYEMMIESQDPSSPIAHWVTPDTSKILEELKGHGIIQIEDYSTQLKRLNIPAVLNNLLIEDIEDEAVLSACLSSMQLWKSYLEEILRIDPSRSMQITRTISRIVEAIKAIKNKHAYTVPDIAVYLYECLGDINATLLLAQVHQIPIYDWDSYLPFYQFKLSRMLQSQANVLDHRSEQLNKLMEVFVPRFYIRSSEQIMAIRENKRFAAVRVLLSQPLFDDAEELIREATHDMLQIKERTEKFSKMLKWATFPLQFLPLPNLACLQLKKP